MKRKTIVAVACAFALIGGTIAVALAPPSGKFLIVRGGTYSGNWTSDDPKIPVVFIKTREPVIIENSTLHGAGDLISSHYSHANVTIRNTRGSGGGRFASIEGFDHVVVENCTLEGTIGIYLLDYAGDRSTENTIKIFRNRAKNIDGRKPNGKHALVQFAQLDKVIGVPHVEIAWNEVINEPGKSLVEDVISIYLSSGTKESPLRIHDNFIRGAYPPDPAKDEYSGGGIMLGDGVGKTKDQDPAYIVAHDNQVLDTTNYGIAISAGHDCEFRDNRIVSAGLLPDGRKIAAQNVGGYIWDSHKIGGARFYNNSGRDNVIGWINKDGRNDAWCPNAAAWEGLEKLPDPITPAMYDQEWKRWQEKLKDAKVSVGVIAAPATQP